MTCKYVFYFWHIIDIYVCVCVCVYYIVYYNSECYIRNVTIHCCAMTPKNAIYVTCKLQRFANNCIIITSLSSFYFTKKYNLFEKCSIKSGWFAFYRIHIYLMLIFLEILFNYNPLIFSYIILYLLCTLIIIIVYLE